MDMAPTSLTPAPKPLRKRILWGIGIAFLLIALVWGFSTNGLINAQGRFRTWQEEAMSPLSLVTPLSILTPLTPTGTKGTTIPVGKGADSKFHTPWR